MIFNAVYKCTHVTKIPRRDLFVALLIICEFYKWLYSMNGRVTYLLKNLFNHAGHTQHICKNTMGWFSDGACYTYKLS
jgi:hypothetical protein